MAKYLGKSGLTSFSTQLWDANHVNESFSLVLHKLGGGVQ